MDATIDMTDRHARHLAELTELGMALARKLQKAAMEAKDPDQAAGLAGAFHRISRSVRQSMALEAKLERDAARAGREDSDAAARDARARINERKDQLRARIGRLIWTEADRFEKLSSLGSHLVDLEHVCDILDEPIEAQIARISRALKLKSAPPPAHPRESGDPSGISAPPALAPNSS